MDTKKIYSVLATILDLKTFVSDMDKNLKESHILICKGIDKWSNTKFNVKILYNAPKKNYILKLKT